MNIDMGKDKRIIIFTTKECLENMAKAEGLACDGTFKSTPKQFKQVLIIAGEVCPGYWCPFMYIWCPDKMKITYNMVFTAVKSLLEEHGLTLKATYIIMDFEVALRSAFKEIFPWIDDKGCHFHLGQSVWRFVLHFGLKSEYSKVGNEDLQLFVHCAISLAFVPLDLLMDAFSVLINFGYTLKEKFIDFADQFLKYFYDTWIDGNYKPESWNFFLFKGRTNNNYLEGYNRHFNNDSFLQSHPNCYKLCEFIKKELIESSVEAFAVERQKSARRDQSKKYKDLKTRREEQMLWLDKKNDDQKRVHLPTFMTTVGYMTFHGDDRIKTICPIQIENLSCPKYQSFRTNKDSKQAEKENAQRLSRPGTLSKEQGMEAAKKRLSDLNFVLSPTQPDTLGEFF